MFRSKSTPPSTESIISDLERRHQSIFGSERLNGVCEAFGADEPHPGPRPGSRRSALPVLTPEETLAETAAAYRRIAVAEASMGLADGDNFNMLPRSKTNYLLAHTDQRLFVFDGTGKTYLLQAHIKGTWLQAIDHRDGMFTLVFHSDDEKVAVTTRRDSAEMTRSFIDSFPDRRDQARVIDVTHDRSAIGF